MGRDAGEVGGPSARLVGLEGPGMRGVAQVLARQGEAVSGTIAEEGATASRLRRLGIRVDAGHAHRRLPRSTRILIHDPDLPRTHPARLAATLRGIEQTTPADAIGRCLGQGVGMAVSGDRRAGVAASMIGWTLNHCGYDPTVILDTFTPQLGGWGRSGRGPHVVAEVAAEEVSAEIMVLIDGWIDPAERSRALRSRVAAASPGDYLLGLALEGDPDCANDHRPSGVEVERFSLARGVEWWGADVREAGQGSRFRAFHRGRFVAEVRLQVPGLSAVVSALATVAACTRAEIPARGIKEALEEFAGVSRGFESRGSYRGVTLLDDEARGPSAVGEALAMARRVHGRRRLCVVYRPDGAGATGLDAGEFAPADLVWIVDELGRPGGPMAGLLAGALIEAGIRVSRVACLDEAIRELDRDLEPGDVLVTLGAGDVGTIADAFLRRVSRDRHD
ncbi:glutamate ligase domain-containing protein [Tundrisphaera sp. TA3]|uniref:glutamate ligase domain-containing protein n=1 Tax=Tundrisphaera sp. TA3 TaxID=3435775 RepID=UPI003EB6C6A2